MLKMIINVTNLNDSGKGSLRDAIVLANKNEGSSIYFQVKGTIYLKSKFEDIVNNTNIGDQNEDYPTLEVNFGQNEGFVFRNNAHGSRFFGLSIINVKGDGIKILGVNNMVLNKLSIGINLTGQKVPCTGNGIFLYKAHNNEIGINPENKSKFLSNIISGNGGNGIYLCKSNGNIIRRNIIGTNLPGQTSVGNGKNGIELYKSSKNIIGGDVFINSDNEKNDPTGNKGTTNPVFIIPPQGNLISGNADNGLLLRENSDENLFNGNFVGTTLDGQRSISNGGDGIMLDNSHRNNLSGCKAIENPFVYYNVISGNVKNGICVKNSNGTIIQGNFVGINAQNSYPVPNLKNGLLVEGNSKGTICGQQIPLGNTIAGNGLNGILVKDTASDFISFNTFNGVAAFGGPVPNRLNGTCITSTGENIVIRTCVISGNVGHGVALLGDSKGVTIDPCIIGCNTNSSSMTPNGKSGIYIGDNSSHNTIASDNSSVIPNTVSSGNNDYGIVITDNAHHNKIEGCSIGLNTSNLDVLSNTKGGVVLSGKCHHNTIEKCNITGIYNFSVFLDKDVYNNTVVNNIIGENRLGIPIGTQEGNRIIDKSSGKNNVQSK